MLWDTRRTSEIEHVGTLLASENEELQLSTLHSPVTSIPGHHIGIEKPSTIFLAVLEPDIRLFTYRWRLNAITIDLHAYLCVAFRTDFVTIIPVWKGCFNYEYTPHVVELTFWLEATQLFQ